MSLNDMDHAYLNDFLQFGYMNHIVAAIALYNAGLNSADTAAELRMHVEQISSQNAERMARRLNDEPRVQKIVVAKLMVELMGAVEDFGAFCWVIRTRRTNAVFVGFMKSPVSAAAQFFDYALSNPSQTLGELLKLPALEDLSKLLPNDLLSVMTSAYAAYPNRIQWMANLYRNSLDLGVGTAWPQGLHATWPDDANILIGAPGDGGSLLQNSKGLFVQAANKVKHRFTVVEDLGALVASLSESDEFPYFYAPIQPENVDTLFENILSASICTAEIAALLLELNNNDVGF